MAQTFSILGTAEGEFCNQEILCRLIHLWEASHFKWAMNYSYSIQSTIQGFISANERDLKPNSIYKLQKFMIKPSKQLYKTNDHKHHILFTNQTTMVELPEGANNIDHPKFRVRLLVWDKRNASSGSLLLLKSVQMFRTRLVSLGILDRLFDSNITLTHFENSPSKGQAILFVGDLSYADSYPNHDIRRWDSWGRFVERSTTYQPWIWTTGNHELDFAPEIGEIKPFKPFTHSYCTPYRASGSTEPFWYSIKRGPAYIIVLASYSAYGTHHKTHGSKRNSQRFTGRKLHG